MLSSEVLQAIADKRSQLCIGLDLQLPVGEILPRSLEIIDLTADLSVAYKPNRQFWLGQSLEDMQELTARIRKHNCVSIIDHKLSDIESSNQSALEWSKLEGFDLITVSPFPGNLNEICNAANSIGIGVFGLVMMSNPQANWLVQGPYKEWAKIIEENGSGMVMGTTNHVTEAIISEIASIVKTKPVLAPGLGHQGGKMNLLHSYFDTRVIYNVSRGIILADDIRNATERYYGMINNFKV
ncbi:MAG: orotidine 5'-phosphate decarboxylase / HUMPS family protein [Candidatus Kariarchaeaceae archaeon]|jgi:orotidine-5'-phosphate decarboxylase